MRALSPPGNLHRSCLVAQGRAISLTCRSAVPPRITGQHGKQIWTTLAIRIDLLIVAEHFEQELTRNLPTTR